MAELPWPALRASPEVRRGASPQGCEDDATKPGPGAAATLWAGRIWPDSFVAPRRRCLASTSSARLALEPNRARAGSREFRHGLLAP